MPFHTVQQGETLFALAAANGLKSWKDILDAPENAALKKIRPDPGILLPGDKLFIPNKTMKHDPSEVNAKHSFNVGTPKAWLRIAIQDADGSALAGKKYELTVEGKTFSGTLAANGVLEHAVGVASRSGTLKVWIDAETIEEWQLQIGAMDPLDSDSGITSRLQNLGIDIDVDDTLRQQLLEAYTIA